MKGQGTFRRVADGFNRLVGRPVTHNLLDPRDRKKKRGTGSGYAVQRKVGQKRRWRSPPPCIPGSITYHDKLVRHFGRKEADKYGRCILAKQLDLLPTAEEFAANRPWAFLSTGTG